MKNIYKVGRRYYTIDNSSTGSLKELLLAEVPVEKLKNSRLWNIEDESEFRDYLNRLIGEARECLDKGEFEGVIYTASKALEFHKLLGYLSGKTEVYEGYFIGGEWLPEQGEKRRTKKEMSEEKRFSTTSLHEGVWFIRPNLSMGILFVEKEVLRSTHIHRFRGESAVLCNGDAVRVVEKWKELEPDRWGLIKTFRMVIPGHYRWVESYEGGNLTNKDICLICGADNTDKRKGSKCYVCEGVK